MRTLFRKLKRLRRDSTPTRHRLQDVRAASGLNLKTLGSTYGGWTFHDDGELKGTTIVSAGLGEDASFDVEFAAQYGAKVIVVDPTPRAISHFDELTRRIGQTRTKEYVASGQQPVEAYDLSSVMGTQLVLEPRALWNEETKLRFFMPADANHVSHSVVNFQNDYRKDTDHIEVSSCHIGALLKQHGIAANALSLLKLDIEGAEIEVLKEMMARDIRPRQICVEFDELSRPSTVAFERVDSADAALRAAGYTCVYGDGRTDFLYLREARYVV